MMVVAGGGGGELRGLGGGRRRGVLAGALRRLSVFSVMSGDPERVVVDGRVRFLLETPATRTVRRQMADEQIGVVDRGASVDGWRAAAAASRWLGCGEAARLLLLLMMARTAAGGLKSERPAAAGGGQEAGVYRF